MDSISIKLPQIDIPNLDNIFIVIVIIGIIIIYIVLKIGKFWGQIKNFGDFFYYIFHLNRKIDERWINTFDKASNLIKNKEFNSKLSGISLFETLLRSSNKGQKEQIILLLANIIKVNRRFSGQPIYSEFPFDLNEILKIIGKYKRNFKLDFSNINFSNADFDNGNFSNINFSSSYFGHRGINNVKMKNCDFQLSIFKYYFINNSNLSNSHFTVSKFVFVYFSKAILKNCNFANADCFIITSFKDSILDNADFRNISHYFKNSDFNVNENFKYDNQLFLRHLNSTKSIKNIKLDYEDELYLEENKPNILQRIKGVKS